MREGELAPKTGALSVISEFVSFAGNRILDVGCGRGVLARSLADRGARIYGVDPNGEALAVARRSVPEGTFYLTGAEAMPFADRSFDGVIFLNSLHHIPESAMSQALREAARVTKPAAPIPIIEPLAEGSLFSVLRTVEDETDIRAAAQSAIDEALQSGAFEQLGRIDYLRQERFEDSERFLAHAVVVDPARAAIVEERRSEIEATFRRYARIAEDGKMILEQPMRARVLATRV